MDNTTRRDRLATELEVECPTCEGSGRELVLGKTNDPTAMEPPERWETCGMCDGHQHLYIFRCERCGRATDEADRFGPWDECDCSEGELEAFEIFAVEHQDAFQITGAAATLLDYCEDYTPTGTRRSAYASDRVLAAALDEIAHDLRLGDHPAASALATVLQQMAETRKPKSQLAREMPF